MRVIEWLGRALSEKGEPSSKRLNPFIATCVLSVSGLILTVRLVWVSDPIVGEALNGICYALAGIGIGTYAFGKFADRNKQDQP